MPPRDPSKTLYIKQPHSELLGFRTLSIVRYSKNQKTQHFGNLTKETDPVSEILCSLVFRITSDGQSPKPQ
jgi:hypothetical protein